MPKTYKVTNKQGQTVTFRWNAPGKPSKVDLDQVFAQHQERTLQRGREKIEGINKQTEEKIGQIPYGKFTQEHPTLSKMLESTEALGGGIAEGAVGLAAMPYDVGKGLYEDVQQPLESAKLLGRGITHPSEVKEAIPFVPQAEEMIAPSSPYGRERAVGQIAGMGILGAGVGAAMRGTPPPSTELATLPKVEPPFQPAGLLEPRTIDVGPIPPPEEIGGAPLKALPLPTREGMEGTTVPRGPIAVPGKVAKSEAVVTPAEIPPKTEYPYPMPGKVAPIQVLKYDPKTGVAQFVGPDETPQEISIDKGTKLEVQEHQKVSGETEPAAALQDVMNADERLNELDRNTTQIFDDKTGTLREMTPEELKEHQRILQFSDKLKKAMPYSKEIPGEGFVISKKPFPKTPKTMEAQTFPVESPMSNIPDEDIKAAADMGDKSAQEELMRRSGGEQAPSEFDKLEKQVRERISPWTGEPSPILKEETSTTLTPFQAGDTGVEKGGESPLPQVQNFVTDPSTGKQVPIQHLPPVEPPEPLEFGRPAEGLRIRQEKLEQIKKSKQKSDDILKRLLNEEEGAFTPEEMKKFILKRTKNFQFDGLYDLTIGTKSYKIYRDPESGNWFEDKPLEVSGGMVRHNFLGFTKEDAVRKLLGESNKSPDILKRLIEEESGSFVPEEIWNWVKDKAKGKDDRLKSVGFSVARARLGAIQHTLRKNPQTRPIADLFTQAEDYQDIFTSVFSRMANEALKLPLKERVQTWEILNNHFDPIEAAGKSDSKGVPFSQKAIQSAIDQRDLFLRIHEMLPLDATKTDRTSGFIPNYITHLREVAAGDTEFAKSFNEIWNQLARDPLSDLQDFFRAEKTTSKEGADVKLVDRATGKPRSPFVERRNNKITTLETDPLRIWPVYLESIGRLIFRKPVVKIAKGLAGDISEGTTKEAATQYIRHFSGYTDFPNLRSTTGRAVNVALRAGARAVLGLSPRLQELHFGRLLTNVFPELGPRYAASGVAEFLKNPKAAMEQARSLGLAQQSKIPFRMKTPVEKLDYILFWGDLGNTMARAMAYKGFLKRAVDSGLSGTEATMKAIGDLKDSDQWVGASRYIPLFDPENPIFRTVTQYKVIPTMIADQYARILGQWKSNPLRVMYAAAAAYAGYQAQKHWGIHLFHLTPSNLKFTGAAIENQAAKVLSKVGKGDFTGALKDMIPASGPVQEVGTIGPFASEEERAKYFRSKSAKPKSGALPAVKPLTPQRAY